jgi:hypothetical protein
MRQALPFFGKSAAGEYLANVHREAAATPSTLLVDVDDLVNASSSPPPNSSPPQEHRSGDASLLPLLETDDDWKDRTLLHFARLQDSLARFRENKKENTLQEDLQCRKRAIAVPPLKDAASWHRFCFGSDPPLLDSTRAFLSLASQVLPDKGEKVSMVCAPPGGAEEGSGAFELEGEGIPSDQQEEGPQYFERMPPSIALVVQFDQVLTQKVLVHYVGWFERLHNQCCLATSTMQRAPTTDWAGRQDHTVRECRAIEALTMLTCHNTSARAALEYQLPERCRWAYALLANLASPVHRDTLADVRELFVAASGLYIGFQKSRDPTFDASLRSLAVLCVVTGRHFRQAE